MLREEDEEDRAAIWEFVEKRMQRLQYNPGEAYKTSLTLHNGPTVPMGTEAEEAVPLGRFFPLGLIWPSQPGQRATFTFERVHPGSGGLSLRHQQRVLHATRR